MSPHTSARHIDEPEPEEIREIVWKVKKIEFTRQNVSKRITCLQSVFSQERNFEMQQPHFEVFLSVGLCALFSRRFCEL